MGILDELRAKASEKKLAQQQKQPLDQQLAVNYKYALLPKMQQIFTCLDEVVKHMNVVEPVPVYHYTHRYPQLGELQQHNYRINTDGFVGLGDFNRLMQINLTFFLQGEGAFSYEVKGKHFIEQEVSFLHSRNISFQWVYKSDKIGSVIGVFTVQRKIPVRFRIEVLYEASQLLVTIDNHENFAKQVQRFAPEDVTEETLDSLLNYLLRRNNDFMHLGQVV